jgi:hypothetical protein
VKLCLPGILRVVVAAAGQLSAEHRGRAATPMLRISGSEEEHRSGRTSYNDTQFPLRASSTADLRL